MSLAVQIALGRTRVALMAMGLAWLAGFQASWIDRASIGCLVVFALILDGAAGDRSLADAVVAAKPPPAHPRPAP